MKKFSLDELMVIEAARYIEDYEVVFSGTGLPLISTMFAQKTHAPHLCYVVETGPIAPLVLPTPLSVSDSRAQHRAVRLGSLREVLGCLLQRGLADVGFLGGAQIDQYGNINSTVVGDYQNPEIRFPGSGGANDIASHARKIFIITRHEKRRFPEKCDFITSPGYLGGPDDRKRVGLAIRKPLIRVITDLTVMEISRGTGRFRLSSLMPGVSVERVLEATGFRPEVPSKVEEVKVPTEKELQILREEVDPNGFYLKSSVKRSTPTGFILKATRDFFIKAAPQGSSLKPRIGSSASKDKRRKGRGEREKAQGKR
jgi:glutaconate CoA-transferase subunit B